MSLDITIYFEGSKKECPHCKQEYIEKVEVADLNITHNLGQMATEAGLYEAIWRPKDVGASKCKDISFLLESGLGVLKARPDHFKKFNHANGWGKYENFVKFVQNYLDICKTYPEGIIRVCR